MYVNEDNVRKDIMFKSDYKTAAPVSCTVITDAAYKYWVTEDEEDMTFEDRNDTEDWTE